MKLFLLLLIMDAVTLIAYPFVFMHSKLRQLSKAKQSPVTVDSTKR